MKTDKTNIFLKTFCLVNSMFTKSEYNKNQERRYRLCKVN